MRKNIYLKIIRILIYISLFIPLIIVRDFLSPFLFGKLMVFRLVIGLMLVCYIPLAISQRKYRPKKSLLVWTSGFFVFIYLLTSFTGVSTYQSFWGTLERMGGWYNLFFFWLFFLIITSTIKTKKEWMNIFKVSIGISTLACIYGFGQATNIDFFVAGGGRAKIVGTAGNAALFAGYILFNFFLSFWFLLKKGILSKGRVFFGVVCLIQIAAIFMTRVRGSIIALISGIFLTLLLCAIFNIKKNKQIFRISLAVVILLMVLSSGLWLMRNTSFVKSNSYLSRITDISLKTRTVQTRISVWQKGLEAWQGKFWLGWGPENFGIAFAKYFDPKIFEGPGSETLWDRAHNIFLETGTTMGIIGLLSYLSIFVVLLYYLFKSCFKDKKINKLEFSVFLSLFAAYFVHNSFIFDIFSTYLILFLIIGYINYRSGKTRTVIQKDADIQINADVQRVSAYSEGQNQRGSAIVVLVILFLIISYLTVLQPIKANYAAAQAILFAQSEKHEHQMYSIEKFKQALDYNTFGKYKIRNKVAQYMIHLAGLKKLNSQEKRRALELAIEAEKKNTQEFKNDYICRLYLTRLCTSHYAYFKEKQILEVGEQAISEALKLSPNFPRSYFESGQIKLLKGDYQSAIDNLRRAARLNPQVSISRWYLGLALAEFGDVEEGLSEINKAIEMGYGYSTKLSDIERLRKIYTELGDYEKVAELYEKAIKLEPSNAQLYASLATAYKENGEIDKAIETARMVGELDPAKKAEAEAWINMLKNM